MTLAGWLVALASIGIVVVLMALAGPIWAKLFPDTRYVPKWLAFPAVAIGALVFMAAAQVLKTLGVPVVKPTAEEDKDQGNSSLR